MTSPTPARVSGPTAYSQRTDNGQPKRDLPDAKYGDAKEFMALQQAAPLANGPDRPSADAAALPTAGPAGPQEGGPPGRGAPEITPLTAPSAYPGQPVTAGMQSGPQGPRARPELRPGQFSDALRQYAAADDSGVLADFVWRLAEMGL